MSATSKKKATKKKVTKKKPAAKKTSKNQAAGKKAAKKKTAKKQPAGKKATKKKSTSKKTTAKKQSLSGLDVSAEERWKMIAVAAYHRAEKRGFAGGHELEDWTAAEKEIDKLLYGK